MINDWAYVLSVLLLVPLPLFFILLFTLRITLDRRVRKALSADKVYNSPLDWHFGYMRTIGFAYAIVFERAKHYAMKDYYDGFNIKTFANPFEKTLAYLFVINTFIFLSTGALMLTTDILGIYNWSD